MTTFKDVLCLLAIFVAYGIVGRLDYEDAVGLEQIRQERLHADLPDGRRRTAKPWRGSTINPSIHRPAARTHAAPEDGQPCTPRVL
jgi:hypothetical protein